MKVVTALTNRLGNRSNNQDRCLILERSGRILLVVADGMGGHARGDLAAQTAIDSLSRSFLDRRGLIEDPEGFLENALHSAHIDVVDAGRAEYPPVDPRTTCVVCLVQGDQAWWAHLGDSRLYLLRAGTLLTRTRDHTPVEELLRNGAIAAEDLRTHPLRNSVSRCLGGALKLPKISFDHAQLQTDDILLLCSDGLWSALPEQRLVELSGAGDLERNANLLTDEAELASYPRSDNISLVCLRWLSGGQAPSAQSAATPPPASKPPPADEEQDELQQAIDDIHRAMLEYAAEMKK
ncbi:MAG TPA: serine/threonine-protein phosphatase [Gammaproteobacteria bacterium]|nr:serine/threonine-protein phosphatase [Gammaproteobacteria bacterium]